MMKQIIFILTGILIIAIGVWITFFFNKNTSQTQTSQKNSQPTLFPSQQVNNTLPSVTITPLKLPSQICEITDANGNKRTVYTKETNVRVDFQTSINNTKLTNVLYTNNSLYTWNKNEKKGTVLNLSKLNNNPLVLGFVNRYMSQLTQLQNCQQTALSDSVFAVPSDIIFTNSSSFNQ